MRAILSRFLSPLFWTQLADNLRQTIKRFPFASLCLLILALLLISEIHNFNILDSKQTAKTALFLLGGACWFVAISLFSESKQWPDFKHYLVAIAALAFYAWQIFSHENITITGIGLAIAAALSMTFSPWLSRKQDNNSFWYFNFQLISDIFFASLSAILLAGGSSLILVSIGYLFDVDIDSELYGDIWVLGTVLFGGFYFLANIPRQFDYSRADCSQFPKGIQFIQTYVLVPLSLVYMAILYAYFIKILFQWELPQGHLGIMISTFGLIGIITHLTIYPVHNRAGLLGWFYRNFYLAMIIPLGLFILAIAARINQYGLTEKRYILVLVAIWFAILIIIRLIRRKHFSLSTVTLSLATLCLIGTIGPWSITTLPLNSQFSRLETLLTEQKMLVDGNYITPTQQPNFETNKSISSMIDYIISRDNGLDKLRPWFTDQSALDKALACEDDMPCPRHYNGTNLVSHMGINYINRWQQENNTHTNIRLDYNLHAVTLALNGFDYFIPIAFYRFEQDKTITSHHFDTSPDNITLLFDDADRLQVTLNDQQTLTLDLNGFVNNFNTNGEITISASELNKMIVSFTENDLEARLYIKSISFITESDTGSDKQKMTQLEGYLLLKNKAFD